MAMVIAKGSCTEVRAQLYVALDAGFISNEAFGKIIGLSHEVSKLIGGLRSAVQKQRDSQ